MLVVFLCPRETRSYNVVASSFEFSNIYFFFEETMMRLTCLLLLLFLRCFFCHGPVAAQDDFFWSAAGFGNGQVVNSDTHIVLPVGSTDAMHLYYSTNGPAMSQLQVGAILQIETSAPGIIEFLSGETFDFDIVLFDDVSTVIDQRLRTDVGGGNSGPALGVSADFIYSFYAFTGLGTGIINQNTGPVTLDMGYDSDANAFYFGRVDFLARSVGEIEIITGPRDGDPGNIVDSMVPLEVTFNQITIEVIKDPIPGDVNHDGQTNAMDIPSFVSLLVDGDYQIEADLSADGAVDLQDVEPFVDLLLGG